MSEIGAGLVGYRFMGRAHSNACRQAARFFDVNPAPRTRAIRGRDEEAAEANADTLGWESNETDYERLLERDDIDLVDMSSSSGVLDEAREMVEAAWKAGAVDMICHNNRRVPAVRLVYKPEGGANGEV